MTPGWVRNTNSDRLLGSDILVALKHSFHPSFSGYGLYDLNQSAYTSGTRCNSWPMWIRTSHLSSGLEVLMWQTLRITGKLWVFVDIWYKSNSPRPWSEERGYRLPRGPAYLHEGSQTRDEDKPQRRETQKSTAKWDQWMPGAFGSDLTTAQLLINSVAWKHSKDVYPAGLSSA